VVDALALKPDLPPLELAPSPADDVAKGARDVVSIQERYPLLRNAL
jgi:hypothetical protein